MNQLPENRFRGAFVIVGCSMQMTPPLDPTVLMRKIVLVGEFHPEYALFNNQDHPSIALLRYLLKGMFLYQEDDHQRLTADPTIYTPSSDGRPFGFLPYRTGIAPAFRRDAIIVGSRPHVPQQTHSQATAAHQHQHAPLPFLLHDEILPHCLLKQHPLA
jgi:hypothetical protein